MRILPDVIIIIPLYHYTIISFYCYTVIPLCRYIVMPLYRYVIIIISLYHYIIIIISFYCYAVISLYHYTIISFYRYVIFNLVFLEEYCMYIIDYGWEHWRYICSISYSLILSRYYVPTIYAIDGGEIPVDRQAPSSRDPTDFLVYYITLSR